MAKPLPGGGTVPYDLDFSKTSGPTRINERSISDNNTVNHIPNNYQRNTPRIAPVENRHTGRNIFIATAVIVLVIFIWPKGNNKGSGANTTTPAQTIPVTYATVRQDLNMRSGPAVNYTVVQILGGNTRVEIVENTGAWTKIRYNGREGYSDRNYLRIDASPTQVPRSNYNAQATPPSYTPVPAPPSLPSINIENNTGSIANSVYVSRSDSDSWGNNRLSGMLQNGYYLKVQLADPLTASNTYDIRLRISESISYTKYNVRITDNARIRFTSNDRD